MGSDGRMTSAMRGRVLRAAWQDAPASEQQTPAYSAPLPKVWRSVVLTFALPLFAGLFVYVVDAPALYALAKAWPLLTSPLAIFAVWRLRLPYQPLVLLVCAWLLGVTPFISTLQLGNDLLGATASSVKIWPLIGAFGAAALLWMVRPSPLEVARAVLALGLLTFAFLIGAWLLASDAAFNQTIETTKIFLSDPERGRRINAPMMFGILGLFLVNRSFWTRPALWKLALVVIGLVAMITIYKQRAQIGGTVMVLGFGAILSLGRGKGPVLLIAAAIAIAGVVPGWLWLHAGAIESLGGSLSIRQIEADAAFRFLNDQPWRWITGVGSATRVGGVTLGDIVGTPFFFPSDLGWLGVVFEYGLIGAGLMLALHLAAIRMAWRATLTGQVMGRALFDYAVFLLVVSPVVSVVLSPGELATVMALSWWLTVQIRTPAVPPYDPSGSAP